MRSPRGHLTEEGTVLVPDQSDANRLYNKGFTGTPQAGGALRLSLMEAARLVEEERLTVTPDAKDQAPLSFRDLLERAVAEQEGAQIPFFAYRDLRARGYVTRHANKRTLDFLVYERGEAPPKNKPGWLAGAINERTPLAVKDLLDWLEEAREEDAELALLVVDEEGDLTHYKVSREIPDGDGPALPTGTKIQGTFLRDRVLVWDEQAAGRLRESRWFGQIVPGGIQLSLVEAQALAQADLLDCPGLKEQAPKVESDIDLRTACYQDLVRRGLWVKTGYKFGAHFRVYDEHPNSSHAPWLVDAVDPEGVTSWPTISRAVRLAHSVRKHYLLGIVDGSDVQYVMIQRFRP